MFTKLYHWCVANKLLINSDKTNSVLFHIKNKPVPKNFTCIQTDVMQITRVKSVQYLGMSLDENLYWHDHVHQICASLVKYFVIFNHIKNFVSLRISKQLYYAFIYSRIQYSIEAYGSYSKESLSKLQIMQNKLLRLLLKWDRRTPTDLVHQRLSILKIDDVHIAKVFSFVNECRSCRVPEMFVNYYKIRERGLNLRNRSSLDIPWARTDLGHSWCGIKGARLWNNHLQTTSQLLYKKSFHKQFSKFLTRKYNWFKITFVSHIFDSKLHQSEFYVYENYVVYLHVYHVRSCSPTPTYKQPLYGCQPDEPQASLATTNRCNHVYVVLFFILLFMYAVIHCLYSVGNKITTTTTTLFLR